jgi:aspartyl protease family protein
MLGVMLACASAPAMPVEVAVIGLFPGKALVVIDRGAPRTLSVGQRTPEGVVLLSADSKSATLEVDGRREVRELGQHAESAMFAGERQSVVIAADAAGHFSAEGQVNGSRVRFLVDTGATLVTLSTADAQRLGIDYRKGQQAVTQTANGKVMAYRVRLDSVAVGPMTLFAVDAVVNDAPGLDVTLLGMSFLNRTEMRREGGSLTLTKRY